MHRTVAVAAVLVGLTVAAWVPAVHAGGVDIRIGLPVPFVAPFVPPVVVPHARRPVFHRAVVAPRVVYPARPIYAAPAYVAPAPVVASPTVIEYPHGRYELHCDYGRYTWVWVPRVAGPPPPPPYPPAQYSQY
ncbi:MAG TPA: hypothetical protein VGL09_10960 [Methylomirabilota bacterium]|jgi:hypothetical protein